MLLRARTHERKRVIEELRFESAGTLIDRAKKRTEERERKRRVGEKMNEGLVFGKRKGFIA